MAKVFKYLLLPASLLLNLCLLLLFFSFDGLPSFIASHEGLTWSKKPALDAESVAALNCSGHGRAFLDGVLLHGTPVCECYGCYAGPDCSEFRPEGCVVELDSGAPLFMEPYWIQHQRDGAVMMSVWHRMSYYMIGESMISSELERHIRGLHNIVGNANVTGKFIVFGVGAMQLLNAAVYALSINENSVAAPPAKVVATVPYYPVYRIQTELLNARSFQWHGNTSQLENESDQSANFIEYVTSPSNPDGGLREAVLTGPLTKAVYDRVYYWPHFSAIPSPADDDIMIFSLGKITGHAGSRFGWAIIKDEKLSQKFMDYVETNVITVSHDTQLRALMIIKAILGRGKEVFEFGHKTLRDKWQRLNSAISKSKRFSLQKLDPQYCTYFRAIREPSPGYAWLKCEMEEDKDCHAVFSAVGIVGNEGAEFGDESKYVRLSLTKSQDEFEVMLSRIEGLVAEGKEGPKSI